MPTKADSLYVVLSDFNHLGKSVVVSDSKNRCIEQAHWLLATFKFADSAITNAPIYVLKCKKSDKKRQHRTLFFRQVYTENFVLGRPRWPFSCLFFTLIQL